jgi:hypothetical protein
MILNFIESPAMTIERLFGASLAALLLAGWASAEDLQETVRRQGEEIESLKAEVQQYRTDRKAALQAEVEEYLQSQEPVSARSAVMGGTFGGRVKLGGYFSIEFRDDGDRSTMEFDQHRLVPKIQAVVADGILFETEIEFEGGGADQAFLSDNYILVEYAELRFDVIDDLLTFKAGALLIGWGRFNKYHDDPLNDLTDRPEVSSRIGAVAFDQPGVGAEGTFDLGNHWFLDYEVDLVQGFDDDITTNDGARNGRQSFRRDNNDNKQLFWRLVLGIPLRFLDALELGTSGTYGKYDDAGVRDVYGYALEVFLKKGRFEFAGEYMNLRFEQEASAPLTDPRRMDGWYVEGRYHFFPASWRGKHRFLNEESTFTFVVRVEGLDLNHSTEGATFRDDLTQVTIGFNFRPVERSVIKIDYTFVDSKQAGFDEGSADRFTISWASYF